MTQTDNNNIKMSRKKKAIITVSIIFSVILLIIAGSFAIIKIGEIRLRKNLSDNNAKLPVNDSQVIPDDVDAFYNGEAYNYDENLVNILVIGVDKKNLNEDAAKQADAIFLVSINPSGKVVNIIGISRNTITKIDTYGIGGEFLTATDAQLCMAYSFGKDDTHSSELTVKAVSNLLYGVPINGYYTIFMDSVKDIVDAVGGVPVKINEDLTSVSPEMKIGADVVITGNKALGYLRYRTESNEPRLARQKDFISKFILAAKNATLRDITLPLKMYNKLSKNTVTDVSSASAVYLASEATNAEFQFKSIAGTVGFDGTYETFEVDNQQLYKLILDVFYKKIN